MDGSNIMSVVGISAVSVGLLVVFVWGGVWFGGYVSRKITANRKITEKAFWRDTISSREQAVEIVRRAARDFIGIGIIALLTSGNNSANAVIGVCVLALAFFARRNNRAATFLLMVMAVPGVVGGAGVLMLPHADLETALTLAVPGIVILLWCCGWVWMGWRAFQAARMVQKLPAAA